MFQIQNHGGTDGDGRTAEADIEEAKASPPVPIAELTLAIDPPNPHPQSIADTADRGPVAYETDFANLIAQSTNSLCDGQAFDVDEHGHAVLEAILTGDVGVPVVRNGIDPFPQGIACRLVPATIDDLESLEDLGVLALALNMNMVRGNNPRALGLLTKVKDLNAAGMAAYAWGTSQLVPPPPPKPKVRPKPRRSGPRVVFPNLFPMVNDHVAAQTDAGAAAPGERNEPDEAEQTASARDDEAIAVRNNGVCNA